MAIESGEDTLFLRTLFLILYDTHYNIVIVNVNCTGRVDLPQLFFQCCPICMN